VNDDADGSMATVALALAEDVARDTLADAQTDDKGGALRGAALLRRLRAVYVTSGACGARIHSQTSAHTLVDRGVEFVLRVLPSLANKPKGEAAAAADVKREAGATATAAAPSPPSNNPFLPYDERLFVANLSPTHCLLLNKFDVAPLHALVVTRAFEPQTDPLNAADLLATMQVLRAFREGGGGGALAFYNCGEFSGRSQPHKHVQVVPLPFALQPASSEGGGGGAAAAAAAPPVAPIDAIVQAAFEAARERIRNHGGLLPHIFALEGLPFRAYAAPANFLRNDAADPVDAAQQAARDAEDLESRIRTMVRRCAADCSDDDGAAAGSLSYNLLITERWAVGVPRSAERDQQEGGGVACNALAFAGTMLCRSDAELAHVRQRGPMNVLASVGFPWPQRGDGAETKRGRSSDDE
jgi:ATP adenylyltransferase